MKKKLRKYRKHHQFVTEIDQKNTADITKRNTELHEQNLLFLSAFCLNSKLHKLVKFSMENSFNYFKEKGLKVLFYSNTFFCFSSV